MLSSIARRVGLLSLAIVFALAPAAPAEDLPMPEGYWGKEKQWADHKQLIGKDMPLLDLSHWKNTDGLTAEDLAGQIVVIDFWATWCGPCLRALPHNNDLHDKYAEKGVTVLAVCSSRGQEKMDKIVEDMKLRYPVARDAETKSAKAWKVKWWPTYAVVDRKGKVRGIGLRPGAVEKMVEQLIEEQPYEPKADETSQPAETVATIKPEWLEGTEEQRKRLTELEAADAPPALQVKDWLNSEALTLADLKGKVVVLDFWATWCGPCIRSIPHANKLMEAHGEEGLVIIGVTHSRGAEKMQATAEKHGIKYPIAKDIEGKTVQAYKANGFPDYYLIDRAGKLRIADCRNGSVDEAIKALLAEPAPVDGADEETEEVAATE